MPKIIDINMGEMAVGRNDAIIKTGGIGSCVVIVLYDAKNKVGGMAHAMLPLRQKKDMIGRVENSIIESTGTAKYVDESVDNLVREIEEMGGEKNNLKAKLIGGARMFRILSGDKFGIGYKNLEVAKNRLQVLNIPIESEATGGTAGRLAEFNLKSGLVDVSTKI